MSLLRSSLRAHTSLNQCRCSWPIAPFRGGRATQEPCTRAGWGSRGFLLGHEHVQHSPWGWQGSSAIPRFRNCLGEGFSSSQVAVLVARVRAWHSELLTGHLQWSQDCGAASWIAFAGILAAPWRHTRDLAQTRGAWTSRGTQLLWGILRPPSPSPGCSQPRCRGAQPQPTSCLAPGCPVVLSFIFIYLYGECNKTPAGNGGDSLPFPASRPWAGANKEAHCAAQTCLPVLSCARGRGAKKGLCVSVPAPGPSANTRLPAAGSLAAPWDGVSWGRSFTSGGKQGWG